MYLCTLLIRSHLLPSFVIERIGVSVDYIDDRITLTDLCFHIAAFVLVVMCIFYSLKNSQHGGGMND